MSTTQHQQQSTQQHTEAGDPPAHPVRMAQPDEQTCL